MIDAIRDLISNNYINAAVRQIRDLLANSPKLDEAILQSARFQDIQQLIRHP